MELSVGMYVRTEYGIDKIKDIVSNGSFYEDSGLYLEKNGKILCGKEEMKDLRVSYNIIDLIQKNDFVNGEKVSSIQYEGMGYEHINCVQTICEFDSLDNEFYTKTYFNKDIKSIVTKEAFESMSYKVGE